MYTDDERRIFEHDDNRCPGCGAAVSDDEDSPNHDRYFAIGDIEFYPELLCPDCGDNWLEEKEYIEDFEDIEVVERFCQYCDYFGMPEKNAITDAHIQVFYELVDRVLVKLDSVKSD